MSSVPSPRTKASIRSAPSPNVEKRRLSENPPSRFHPKDINARRSTTPNHDIKSKYCIEEINKPEYGRKSNRIDSAPAKNHETRDVPQSLEELRQRDVMFLRKMLAMTKKQEMMLNKRLAKLMEEEEAKNVSDGTEMHKREVEQTPSAVDANMCRNSMKDPEIVKNETDVASKSSDEHPSSQIKEPDDTKVSKTAAARKTRYDINGRRIYNYNDIEKEGVDEQSDQIQEMNNNAKEKRIMNSTKINKKGSASSKKTFTMKKSLTYINKENRVLKKPLVKTTKNEGRVRKEDGDSTSCANSENPLDFSLRPKRVDSQGDGAEIQNVVVRCSTVYSSNSLLKRNVKVWNYGSLHSIRSDRSIKKSKTISSDQRLMSVGGGNKQGQTRPISVRNNSVQNQFKNPSSRKDDRTSKAVETVYLLRNNTYSHVNNESRKD